MVLKWPFLLVRWEIHSQQYFRLTVVCFAEDAVHTLREFGHSVSLVVFKGDVKTLKVFTPWWGIWHFAKLINRTSGYKPAPEEKRWEPSLTSLNMLPHAWASPKPHVLVAKPRETSLSSWLASSTMLVKDSTWTAPREHIWLLHPATSPESSPLCIPPSSLPSRGRHEALAGDPWTPRCFLSPATSSPLWAHSIESIVEIVNAWLVVSYLTRKCGQEVLCHIHDHELLEKNCQLREPWASGVLVYSKVKRIPFLVFQTGVEIADDENEAIAACCDVHEVM